MNFAINDDAVMNKLEKIQESIEVSDTALCHTTYMCDCSACSNGCMSECTDGPGVMG